MAWIVGTIKISLKSYWVHLIEASSALAMLQTRASWMYSCLDWFPVLVSWLQLLIKLDATPTLVSGKAVESSKLQRKSLDPKTIYLFYGKPTLLSLMSISYYSFIHGKNTYLFLLVPQLSPLPHDVGMDEAYLTLIDDDTSCDPSSSISVSSQWLIV